ncbi:MAG: ribose-5-phosphate isomerase RpiA [Methylococcales bacterium]|nr:ribose-5-phosphate isomerase RpiA [Methylococcales bacterium]
MNAKQLAAQAAAALISPGMCVGLGTGSTADCFIDALARRVQHDNLTVTVVASSVISQINAEQARLTVTSLAAIDQLDVYVDGADEIAPDLTVLKGRGQDLVQEKLLAKAAKEFWIIADTSKHVSNIGQQHPVAVEILPAALKLAQQKLAQLDIQTTLRKQPDGGNVFITAAGNLVLDVRLPSGDTGRWARRLDAVPGVIEHGIFHHLVNRALIGDDTKVTTFFPENDAPEAFAMIYDDGDSDGD